ncbi:Tripartite motif-containing protein 2-like [Oopsacas minuta]|uniref:Tripartite motif-containing protein 2-like n=1 Tax=Oopsacas minuta TaxID=111878 RepID=A0AAV7JG10_9METZ|nr:Tripartite motif-containing protein 2-like [Oopsacas minuta]
MESLLNTDFQDQITEIRSKIQHSFRRAYEALDIRESNLLSRQDLRSTANTDFSIDFKCDSQFEIEIEQLGSIKLNGLSIVSPTLTLPPHAKTVIPDYKAKQLPTAYCCKKSSGQKAPGGLNGPRGIAVHYQTGNIYISEENNDCVQIFSCNGDYLSMFSEEMNKPIGICISQNTVLVTQWSSHCSVGSKGSSEVQFSYPYGIAVSDRNSNVYVCDSNNNRVQILTQELKIHSMLGEGLFTLPRDVKVTRDRVLVLDSSDPCMFVFNSDHVLTNRLITRGDGKQMNIPLSFDIDREYNIIMSDFHNHCVYIFNQEGEQIHMFGIKGQGIGEFYYPFGIVLDNTGHIIVVCRKNINCLQFF